MLRWFLTAVLALIGLAALVGAAGYFVLKRPDIPFETLAAKYESAASRYVDLPGGVHMHYRDEGNPNGPPLLLIHGFSASLQTWEPWVQRLGDEYRVISLDLPGHGLTRAPAGYQGTIEAFRDEVAAFAQSQGLTRFSIGGNSMGGHVAWEYALAHPEEIDALILVDSAGWPQAGDPAESGALIFTLLRNPITRPIIRDLDNSRLIRQGLEAAFPAHPELVDDAMVARYTELARAPGHRDIVLHLMTERESRPDATAERLAALQMPVLVMHGADDRLVPFADGQRFHEAIPGSEFAPLDGVGHVPQEEVPDHSAAAIRDFLHRVSAHSARTQAAQ
jgi:pimeloyl-ACP methyl ester carboxylesterase